MWRAGPQARLRAQCLTLDASVERARRALACVYASAEEFEAAVIRARHGSGRCGAGFVTRMQVVLAATAVAALAMLLVMIV